MSSSISELKRMDKIAHGLLDRVIGLDLDIDFVGSKSESDGYTEDDAIASVDELDSMISSLPDVSSERLSAKKKRATI